MLRITTVFLFLLLIVANNAILAAPSVINPIVSAGKALDFGIWKIYNRGSEIILLDQNDFRLIRVNGDVDLLVSDANDKGFNLHDTGTFTPTDGFWYNQFAQETRDADSKGQMQNARYETGDRVFLVNGNELTIFNLNDEKDSVISTTSVLNKFDNGIVHTGRDQVTVIDPTFTVAPTSGVVTIQPAHTGSWYDPANAGSGGFINIAEQGGQSVVVVSWFDYNDDGSQLWLIGSSAPLASGASSVIVPMQITEKDTSGQVQQSDWGTFAFEFKSCDSATLKTTPNSGLPQSIPLTRLTKITGMSC